VCEPTVGRSLGAGPYPGALFISEGGRAARSLGGGSLYTAAPTIGRSLGKEEGAALLTGEAWGEVHV
jgi:hypothetical protein